jgi:hypothetical protein
MKKENISDKLLQERVAKRKQERLNEQKIASVSKKGNMTVYDGDDIKNEESMNKWEFLKAKFDEKKVTYKNEVSLLNSVSQLVFFSNNADVIYNRVVGIIDGYKSTENESFKTYLDKTYTSNFHNKDIIGRTIEKRAYTFLQAVI